MGFKWTFVTNILWPILLCGDTPFSSIGKLGTIVLFNYLFCQSPKQPSKYDTTIGTIDIVFLFYFFANIYNN